MATNQQQPAESSKPPQHKEVEHFTDAERAAWLKDGTMPLLETDSPKPDASAASIPDKKGGSGPSKKEKSADEIKAEQDKNWRALESERDTLKTAREAAEKELEEWRTGKRKPEEKKPDAVAPKLLELPARPKMKEFMDANGALDSDKYEAALDKYEADKKAYENQQVRMQTAEAQKTQIIKEQTAALKAKYSEKADGINVQATMDKLGATIKDAPAFFMFLNDSEVFTDLLYVLGTDPKLDELLAEAKDSKTVTRAVRKLVVLEAGVKAELAKQEKAPKKDDEPQKKDNLTKAGKPPAEAKGGSDSPADDGSSAAAWNRKDLSVADRGELYRERKNAEERAARKKKVN